MSKINKCYYYLINNIRILIQLVHTILITDYMAEWSKALHSGCSPKGQEFKSPCSHNFYFIF